MDGWQWDPTLYAGSAAYYALGRMAYPPEVAEAVAAEVGLDGTQRYLDVGCGPGSLTLLLAPLVGAAVGVDADKDMLVAAKAAAAARGIANARWRHLLAERLPAGLGSFHLVTFAQSFHWMDRPAVAAAVRQMLLPNGVCVHVGATTHRGDGEDDGGPPYDAIDALVADYLGTVRRAGQGVRPGWPGGDEDAVFAAAGFRAAGSREVGGGEVVTRTADQVVAATFSLSYAAPHLFGDRRDAFEKDLRGLLGGGPFADRRRAITLTFWLAP